MHMLTVQSTARSPFSDMAFDATVLIKAPRAIDRRIRATVENEDTRMRSSGPSQPSSL